MKSSGHFGQILFFEQYGLGMIILKTKKSFQYARANCKQQ